MELYKILLGLSFLLVMGCSVDSARHHYVLAERFWSDKNYAAAVIEFERVIAKDPSGGLGQQALYRSAMTQTLFLGQHVEAVQKLRSFIQYSTDSNLIRAAQIQVGEVLFTHLENYEQAVLHYQSLIKLYPDSSDVPSFLFRIAKSQFFLFQFSEALGTFQKIISQFPDTVWSERATLELGTTFFTRGQRQSVHSVSESNDFDLAIQSYRKFIKLYPKSDLAAEARFGIASCLEEEDQLDEAYLIYSDLIKTYPAPRVVEIKISRIKERLAHRRSKR
jgi:tetratricopeptide (TPR) repeat protein